MIIKCKFSGVIDISSIYLNSTYSVQVNAGPPYAKNSYAEVNKTSIIAGSLATIKVFPIDLNNNKVNISSLSIDNIKPLCKWLLQKSEILTDTTYGDNWIVWV